MIKILPMEKVSFTVTGNQLYLILLSLEFAAREPAALAPELKEMHIPPALFVKELDGLANSLGKAVEEAFERRGQK